MNTKFDGGIDRFYQHLKGKLTKHSYPVFCTLTALSAQAYAYVPIAWSTGSTVSYATFLEYLRFL